MALIDDQGRTHFSITCPNPNCRCIVGGLSFRRAELLGLLTGTVRFYCGVCDHRWDAHADVKSKIPGILKQLDQKPTEKV